MFRAAFRSIGIERLRGDVRFAFRNLRQSAGFALTAVMTLGLGIGLSTAVFTVADALLLRPLPVRDQARILVLSGETADGHFPDVPLNYREAREFTRRTRVLQQVAFVTYEGAQPVPVVDRGRLFRLRRSVVSGNYFDLLGTRAIIGRTLNPSDDVVGAAPVAVLSYDGWRRAFGGDSSVIGRQLQSQLDGVSFTVVGVMPQGLEYPAATEYWAPLVPTRTVAKPDSVVADVNLVGRLADRATPGAARAEVTAYFRDLQTNGGPLGKLIIRGVANTLPRIVLGDT
ncbi:MAG: ABC transporter permease, partial [Gemmatimonadales bacterium]